jgi:hypothetical protein
MPAFFFTLKIFVYLFLRYLERVRLLGVQRTTQLHNCTFRSFLIGSFFSPDLLLERVVTVFFIQEHSLCDNNPSLEQLAPWNDPMFGEQSHPSLPNSWNHRRRPPLQPKDLLPPPNVASEPKKGLLSK